MGHLSYAFLGGGALGGFYGAKLQRSGREVHFLLRSDCQHVRQHGWSVRSKDGDFTLSTASVFERAADLPNCDVVVVALKTTANDSLPTLLADAIRPGSALLVLQNGLGIEDDLAPLVGNATVVGGVCFLCCNRVGPGAIHHLDFGRILLGEHRADHRPAGVTPLMEAIANDFRQAGIEIGLSSSLREARWKKLVWNIPYNGLSVALNATTDALMGHPASRALVADLMREVTAAARAEGHDVPDSFADQLMADTDRMTPYLTSMKMDFDAGRPLELRAIFANPLRAAAAAGQPMPRVDALHQMLNFMDERNRLVQRQ